MEKTHTGLNYIKVSDMYDNEIYTASVKEGKGSYKAELLAGDYKLSLCAGFYTGCKFTFTASYKASGETRSEAWLSQNDEKTMSFTYKAGTTYKGQLAFNETTDIYKMKMTKEPVHEHSDQQQDQGNECCDREYKWRHSLYSDGCYTGNQKIHIFPAKGNLLHHDDQRLAI